MPTATGVAPDVKIISADSHIAEPEDLFTTRMPGHFGDRIPHVIIEGEKAGWCAGDFLMSPYMGVPLTAWGGNDPDERIKELERDGIYGEVLYPTLGMYAFRWFDDSILLDAICRAYNDWLAEFCAHPSGRFRGAAMINVDDVESGVKEVERVSGAGFPAALLSVQREAQSYDEPQFDPLWAALEAAGMCIGFHLLSNRERHEARRGSFAKSFSTFASPGDTVTESSHVQKTLADMILSGVFERFPGLMVAAVEFEAAWAVPFCSIMDFKYTFAMTRSKHAGRLWHRLPEGTLPSDYFRRNVFVTFQEDALAVRMREELGTDRLLWGSDYPHQSGTFPESRTVIDELLGEVPCADATRMLQTNAAQAFGF
jgi:predicted TIM-barrel fold metal-dependent hydrolase